MFQGRTLRMENHLNRTFNRDQNPVAAASNSSLVGRWGIVGMCEGGHVCLAQMKDLAPRIRHFLLVGGTGAALPS